MHELLRQIVDINKQSDPEATQSESNFKLASEGTRSKVKMALDKTLDTLRPDNKPDNHVPKEHKPNKIQPPTKTVLKPYPTERPPDYTDRFYTSLRYQPQDSDLFSNIF